MSDKTAKIILKNIKIKNKKIKQKGLMTMTAAEYLEMLIEADLILNRD